MFFRVGIVSRKYKVFKICPCRIPVESRVAREFYERQGEETRTLLCSDYRSLDRYKYQLTDSGGDLRRVPIPTRPFLHVVDTRNSATIFVRYVVPWSYFVDRLDKCHSSRPYRRSLAKHRWCEMYCQRPVLRHRTATMFVPILSWRGIDD